MRKRRDAPENRREIARQPSAKNQPRRAKCPAATNATVSGARIFRDNWEVRKNDADPATVRGDEPATATVDAVYGKARAKKILKPGNYTLNGIHDWSNRRTAEPNGRNDSGNAEPGHSTLSYAKTESEITKIKQRVIRAAQHFAKYRGTAFQDGRTENEDRAFGKRKSAMAEIGTEAEQRKQFITETEHRIAELEQQIEKGRDIDERIQRIKERRTVGRTSALDRGDTRRVGTERPAYRGTKDAAQRISDLEREIKQREQSREYSSIKERLEAGRQSIADREREAAKRKRHDRGMSR